jgi:HEAT repeat protein
LIDPLDIDPAVLNQVAPAEVPLGKFLADMSASIQAWSHKTWSATSRDDLRKQNLLEHHITQEARKRKEELLYSLEAGPQRNRVIAAAALGFTRDPEVLSPLLDALEDADPRLVGNALLGLTILEDPNTPTERIASILQYDKDPELRWGAAYCARTLVERGVRNEGLMEAGRAALLDSEPVVRAQCCLLLAILGDAESFDAMEALMRDSVPLVSAAAVGALGVLGEKAPERRGDCARALSSEIGADDHERRLRARKSLVRLAGRDYGENLEQWRIWARRLP